MKKLMFVTASMTRGGAERVISILSDYYVKHGWDVSIMVLFNGLEGYTINKDVKIIDHTSSRPSRLRFFECVHLARKTIKKEKPDVVLSFLVSICLIMGFACIGLKTKLVCCERNDPAKTKRNVLYRKIINIIYAKCSKTVLQTKRAFDFFPDSVQKNSVIIPNPVKVDVKCNPTQDRFVALGRLTKQKNHRLLIDAFCAVHAKHPSWSLDIYGDGVLEEEIKAQISSLNLEDCVHLKGNRKDIHKEIENASCFVLSSDYEGLSNALIEAMQMGMCCISTNCAGSDDAIENKKNGLLVPVKDLEALTQAMMFAIENPAERMAMGEMAYKTSQSYRVDNVIDLWKEVIENLN